MAGLALPPVVAIVGLAVPAAAVTPPIPAAAVTPPVSAPSAAAVATGTELYVSVRDCAPGADGSVDAPFCSITAAASVAGPGQTVLVQPGNYPEAVSLVRSGSSGAPITFQAVNGPDGYVRVGQVNGAAVSGPIFSLVGVHDVTLDGFTLVTSEAVPAAVVENAARVTLDGLAVRALASPALVRVAASSDVTVSRGWFRGTTVGVSVEAGTTGAVVTASGFSGARVRVADAPGAVVTGNTVVTSCTLGIEVAGASSGLSLRNNIVQTATGPTAYPSACADRSSATAVSVSAGSTPQSVVDHNLIDTTSEGALYEWAGTSHASLEEFRSATGQGAHDIAAPARFDTQYTNERGWFPLKPTSPAIDSADGTAPGSTATDLLYNPHADLAEVPNTGAQSGYHDRGAVEYFSWVRAWNYEMRRVAGGGPTEVVARMEPAYAHPVDALASRQAFKFDGDRYWRVTSGVTARHTFRRAGMVSALVSFSGTSFRFDAGIEPRAVHMVVGANYTPVTPTRLLDTRAAIGVPGTTPVPPRSEILLPISQLGGTPAADISAVTLNVTVTQPTAAGFLTVYPDGSALPDASNVNFVAGETVPNLVTVPVSGNGIRLRNGGAGTVHVIADLQGIYTRTGSGFKPLAPTRVLDTRSTGNTAFGANTTRQLDLSRKLPAGATAAVLNVTVTAPTRAGLLTLFPAGSTAPNTSNLNFLAGQTVANLVVVPVVGGKVSIRHTGSGSTHVIADLAGFYGSASSGATDIYAPHSPIRIVDTRTDSGLIYRGSYGPLQPGEEVWFKPTFNQLGCPSCPEPTSAVLNLTVTSPTAPGFLTLYPYNGSAPTASNLNFTAAETAANLAVVPVGLYRRIVARHTSRGSTQFIVDQAGYFIGPAS